MNKNSNTYIIIYSTVMVVIVAVLLAVASLSLQSRQTANELNEKKSNILYSLGADPATDFDSYVKAYLIGKNGEQNPIQATEAFELMKSNKSLREAIARKQYILFRTEDGRAVVPLIGKGLWDDIWGYIALEPDMNTVSGIVLAHKGETPGLGAEIATEKHEAQYRGKKLFRDGEFTSIVLRKGGAKDLDYEVDAVSGGTKTSDGVTAMLRDCLVNYVPFFEAQQRAAAPVKVEEATNDQNSESNE